MSVAMSIPDRSRWFMFIDCPGDGLSHDLADLGGVWVIV
jgi:hypothetical protein